MNTGRCLCGAITYTVSGPLRQVVACHCKQCQRMSGFHVAATSAGRDTVSIDGDIAWYQSSDAARRGFCGTCGSSLFWDGPGQNLSIFAGTLDAPTGLKLVGHIYCADKGDYYEISDDLPKAARRDPELTTQVR